MSLSEICLLPWYVSVEVMGLFLTGEDKSATPDYVMYLCILSIQQIDTIKTADVTNKV